MNRINLDPKTKPVMTVKEVAEILQCANGAVYDLCHSEGFTVLKIGKGYRIPTARFIAWLENPNGRRCELG